MGRQSILPFSYGGSNGLLTQDTLDAMFFRRLGTSRLARTVCAAPTGGGQAMYGKMPSVTYEDYPTARLIVLWGVNPSTSGMHLVPYVRQARSRAPGWLSIDPRRPRWRVRPICTCARPGPTSPSRSRSIVICSREDSRTPRFSRRTPGAPIVFATSARRGRSSARPRHRRPRAALRRLAQDYASASPALIRCGWGLERNRNGGNAAMAILALPAVAGKFGVRGGGYSMSNSAAWNITRSWLGPEPDTRWST